MFDAERTHPATSPVPACADGLAPPSRTRAVRAILLGGVSILAMAGAMLPSPALADQTISSAIAGPIVADGSAISVTVSGVVSGATGITYGTITTLSNHGVISANSYGITGNGSVGTLTNSGTISGKVGINNAATGSGSSGGVTTVGISGVSTTLTNIGSIGTVTNIGNVTGGGGGPTGTVTFPGVQDGIGTPANAGVTFAVRAPWYPVSIPAPSAC